MSYRSRYCFYIDVDALSESDRSKGSVAGQVMLKSLHVDNTLNLYGRGGQGSRRMRSARGKTARSIVDSEKPTQRRYHETL